MRKTNNRRAPSTRKVRRTALGGKRAPGHQWQAEGRRVQRPDAARIGRGPADASLTQYAGLRDFAVFCRRLGVDAALRERFERLKPGVRVVYPMHTQLRVLLDAIVVGETRVFGVESMAVDPLVEFLAGGAVSSVDVLYDDLARMGPNEVDQLDQLVAEHGLAPLMRARGKYEIVHLDIDTTVTPLFGSQEGASLGHNPKYHSRPSYHPITGRVAETQTFVGAKLRPGDTGFGEGDVGYIQTLIRRVRARVGPNTRICVRIDSAGDCAAIMACITAEPNTSYVVKARMTEDLLHEVRWTHPRAWVTVDEGATGEPLERAAEVRFSRTSWSDAGLTPRVTAVASSLRRGGTQLGMNCAGIDDDEETVRVYIDTRGDLTIDEVASCYDGRAGIEPLIGEGKHGYGIGQFCSQDFDANATLLMLKLLAHNLVRRFVRAHAPALATWTIAWLRRALFVRPGRLIRSGRSRTLRVVPRAIRLRRLE